MAFKNTPSLIVFVVARYLRRRLLLDCHGLNLEHVFRPGVIRGALGGLFIQLGIFSLVCVSLRDGDKRFLLDWCFLVYTPTR